MDESMKQQEDHLAALLMKDVDHYFKQLVETYQHQLYRLMYRQTGSQQDAEDIIQEAFLRAYYALRDYASQGVSLQYVRPWLYKIAFNVYYNRFRAKKLTILPLDIQEEEVRFCCPKLYPRTMNRSLSPTCLTEQLRSGTLQPVRN
jgi:RNA polymerase sigma-70 factor, ECF subfamily